MTTDLDTLVIALYVKIDDDLAGSARLPGRPPKLSHSELLCLAVMQAMLGFHNEARWLRYTRTHLRHLFPYLPGQSGYNKRLRAALPRIKRIIRVLARDTDFWHDTVWITDSTPVPCGMSRPTVKRSDLAGFAGYGYCASHSRFFWGLRLYLVCTPAGMPMLWALADPKLGEREVLAAMLEVDAEMIKDRAGLLLISDKGFASKTFERSLSEQGITLLRPSRKKEVLRAGEPMLKKVRQLIESVNDTLKGQLDLEQHGARTAEGVSVRVAQRVLALAAAIWHNFRTGQPVTRSLTAYDH
ncbi:IS982 family transposase [Saccharopolyspora spinosa]|uniref:DDE family transposase n=2 Tax=Saccharopolyspora spinosa TaxID=60894 RepID=A0A2N3Y2Z4_SACSN|nr:IS982 family transposase [Saccharopolyspora spinosa]PKW13702.1 DDE family transposase [Saccharopolyspora spinosa]PKW14949.1 DDE family transposase [Saccharopolyspora spinosa]PKW17127.1 DDE family transposase [Saccharopolyspora spinosa]PKW17306.1 DDE family transposase [Saccharopolyspora spinosa]PKW18606.1 DDE family transposase [Saccharopolyspora spinosa]